MIYLQAKRLFLFTKMDILFQKKDCVVHNNKAICSWKLVVTVNGETVWQVTAYFTEIYSGATRLSPVSLSAQRDQTVNYEASFPDGPNDKNNYPTLKPRGNLSDNTCSAWQTVLWCQLIY